MVYHSTKIMIFQIDDGMPFVIVNSLPVQWHTGMAAMYLATSSMARLNERGLTFKDASWHVRDIHQWRKSPCYPSPYGLCQKNRSTAFPSTQTPFVDELRDYECASAQTSRAVTSDTRYDTSSCDLAASDFVFAGNTLYQGDFLKLPDWVYWTVCVLMVYLVRCLSKYILATLTKTEFPNAILCITACTVVTVLLIAQGDAVFVTVEDLVSYHFNLFYISTYALLFAGTRLLNRSGLASLSDPPFYNLIAGVMQLVAMRIFAGVENPYTPPLIFIIATRVFVKSRRGNDMLRCTTILLDSIMLAIMSKYGFMPDPLYLVPLIATSWAAADVLIKT